MVSVSSFLYTLCEQNIIKIVSIALVGIPSKDESQLRTLCLQLLRRHPDDKQGMIEEHGDPDETMIRKTI